MDKKYIKLLKEEKDAYESLRNEPPFPASELTQEIFPLLSDYFEGEFTFDGQAIICAFPNGQRFSIAAREIK